MTSRSRLRQFFDDKMAAAAAAETGMPAMPSKAPALKRLGRKAPATRTAEITETPPRERQGFCRFRRCQPPKTEDHKRDRAK